MARDPWSAPAGHQLSCRGTASKTHSQQHTNYMALAARPCGWQPALFFWPGCQTFRLAASHPSFLAWLPDLSAGSQPHFIFSLAARPFGWQPATLFFVPDCQTLRLAASKQLKHSTSTAHFFRRHCVTMRYFIMNITRQNSSVSFMHHSSQLQKM